MRTVMKWSFLMRSLLLMRLRRALYAALSIAIAGCGPAQPGFDTLHPRDTADCSRHLDGSFYGIGGRMLGENVVGAICFSIFTSPPLIRDSSLNVKGYLGRLYSFRLS